MPPVTQTGRARSSHLRRSWRHEHGRGTTGSSSMPSFTAPGAVLLGQHTRGVVSLHLRTLAREGRMAVTIGRRKLLAALGSVAVAWPLAARAQQTAKLPTIGYLGTAAASAWAPWTAAFCAATARTWLDRGTHRRNTISLAEGRTERFAEIAAEFVRLKVDVIVTGGNAAVAAKQASSVVPIVFALASDPV